MNIERLKRHLERDEGIRRYPYKDTLGHLTIGIGRNLDDVGVSSQEIDIMLENDITRLIVNGHIQKITRGLDEVRAEVILNMAFNLGVHGLLGFEEMLSALAKRDWEGAAREMENSVWASQVGRRAERLVHAMRTGEFREEV